MAQVLSSDSFKLGLVIAAATLVTSCCGAPTISPWWYNPCELKPQIRHSRSTADYPFIVVNQLNIFSVDLTKNRKELDSLYNEKMGIVHYQPAKFRKLKLKKWLKSIKKISNATLPEFYQALQYFAGTLEQLRVLKIKNDIPFNQSQRNIVYQNVKDQMKNLMCEVQEILSLNHKPPPKIPPGKMKIGFDNQVLPLTHARTLDLNFFKKLSTFFRQLQKQFKKKKSRSKPTTTRKPKSSAVKRLKRTTVRTVV